MVVGVYGSGTKSKLLYIACKPVGISDDGSINSSPSNWILDTMVCEKNYIYKKLHGEKLF
jgi:hypothetical protein